MTSLYKLSSYRVASYSKYNLSEVQSDIPVLVQLYRERINKHLKEKDECIKSHFLSFAEKKISAADLTWLEDNTERFLKDTPNEELVKQFYPSECGFILCMAYSSDGERVVLGYSTGLIQMRNGITGSVLCTLRNIQFPPKPVYALQYSPIEQNVCYAACMDGAVYRIEIPHLDASVTKLPMASIRADPLLETLNTQFYGSPGISSYSTPFITQRFPALSLGLLTEQSKMVVGYGDTSVKVFDMETQEAETTYKVHKSRLQYIPKKLQRIHFGQVVALRVHPQKPNIFATGAWDKTLRIWDVRCKVGCIMTFEGVDICGDSIDLNREQCISGSWQATEALCLWDLTAKKKLSIIRVQNRRPDVDGEFIYACRYWRSTLYNRKGKYGIIGGSGTNCLEVINLHNRYITCSYPAPGTILAVTSHQERIAFGGTFPAFCIVSFHDPKHEKELYEPEVIPDFDYTKPDPIFFSEDYGSSSVEIPFSNDVETWSQVTKLHSDDTKPEDSIVTSATTPTTKKSAKP